MVTNRDDITVLQRMFLDQFSIDIGAVGAVQVLKEGIAENIDYQRVMPAYGRVVDTHVVVRQAPDGIALLVHIVFGHDLAT